MDGINPLSSLSSKSKLVKLVKFPNSSGIPPAIPFPFNVLKEITTKTLRTESVCRMCYAKLKTYRVLSVPRIPILEDKVPEKFMSDNVLQINK